MPRQCTICGHEKLEAINLALMSGSPYRIVAKQFTASPWAVYRHWKDHMPIALAQSQKAYEISAADSLLEQLLSLHRKTLALLNRAEGAGDVRCALAAVQQGRSNLELLWKLRSELTDGEAANTAVSPEWIETRSKMVQVLERFPQARIAILEVLGDRR
jgi:transposase-like protein